MKRATPGSIPSEGEKVLSKNGRLNIAKSQRSERTKRTQNKEDWPIRGTTAALNPLTDSFEISKTNSDSVKRLGDFHFFGQLLKKLGYFFIPASGHAGRGLTCCTGRCLASRCDPTAREACRRLHTPRGPTAACSRTSTEERAENAWDQTTVWPVINLINILR